MKKQEKRRRKIRQRKEDARLNRRITARLLGVDVSKVTLEELGKKAHDKYLGQISRGEKRWIRKQPSKS